MTILSPGFAQRILSRYRRGAPVLPGADLFYAREQAEGREPAPPVYSLQNIYHIHRIQEENTVLNLNIQFSFLSTLLNKILRGIAENTARPAAMQGERLPSAGRPQGGGRAAGQGVFTPADYAGRRNAGGPLPLSRRQTLPRAELVPHISARFDLPGGGGGRGELAGAASKPAGLSSPQGGSVSGGRGRAGFSTRPPDGSGTPHEGANRALPAAQVPVFADSPFLASLRARFRGLGWSEAQSAVLSRLSAPAFAHALFLQPRPLHMPAGAGAPSPQAQLRPATGTVGRVVPEIRHRGFPRGHDTAFSADIPRGNPDIPFGKGGAPRYMQPHAVHIPQPAALIPARMPILHGGDIPAATRNTEDKAATPTGRAAERRASMPFDTGGAGNRPHIPRQVPATAALPGLTARYPLGGDAKSGAYFGALHAPAAHAADRGTHLALPVRSGPAAEAEPGTSQMPPPVPRLSAYSAAQAAMPGTRASLAAFLPPRARAARQSGFSPGAAGGPGVVWPPFEAAYAVRLPRGRPYALAELPAPEKPGVPPAALRLLPSQARQALPGMTSAVPMPMRGLPENQDEKRRAERFAIPGANIVHRKASQPAPAQEVRAGTPKLNRDIEFIKKTVRQTSSTVTGGVQSANVAVNIPGAEKGTGLLPGAMHDMDRHIHEIADRVYGVLERRLRSEQMRRGIF